MSSKRPGPSLREIAKSCGVSIATVSNALSGKGRVSPDVIGKVRAKAAEMGYVASPAARALRTGRSGVLGLVLPDIGNPLFPQIAQAIEQAAAKAGYGVLIGDSRGEIATQTATISRLIERGVDGMIVVPRRGSRIGEIGCPVAVIDSPSTPGNTVSADHWQGGAEVARHLAGLGHRKLLLIGYSPDSNVQNDRIGGMRSVAGIESEVFWIQRHEAQAGAGAPLGLKARLASGITAIATVSDLQALRVLTELHDAGFRVPEDVSVTGFDDLIWAPVITPALTTVHMDMPQIATLAIEALAQAIEATAPDVVARQQKVPMRLVARRSSAPPRAAGSPRS
ncbi:LacI family transcriptional regulator [Thioclava sp. BHET1]|nr:LacI family transcriptional regulator [Thioclava sp. BHET1]